MIRAKFTINQLTILPLDVQFHTTACSQAGDFAGWPVFGEGR